MTDRSLLIRDPQWLPHRYDAKSDAIHFVEVSRAQHRSTTFLTDDYLPQARKPTVLPRTLATREMAPPGPLHFIFHSAFCCSTLLVRALDRDGIAMGMSEPVILNDIIGWRHRERPQPPQIAAVIDSALDLLARPFGPGEAVVLKPSNLINPLAGAFLAMRPQANAVFVHAPLEAFLGSIARKGLWGRIWIRDLYTKLLREGMAGFDMEPVDQLKLTDIQIAAVCWLAQHQQFAHLCQRFGPQRVRSLNSETLMQDPARSIGALGQHFRLDLQADDIEAIVAGPAFHTHSKSGGSFNAQERAQEHAQGLRHYADEIEKVGVWAREFAKSQQIPIDLPCPLF